MENFTEIAKKNIYKKFFDFSTSFGSFCGVFVEKKLIFSRSAYTIASFFVVELLKLLTHKLYENVQESA